MKTITYPLRLDPALLARVQEEAEMRGKKVAELFRDIIGYGLENLPDAPSNSRLIASAWDSLGPAPDIIWENVPPTPADRL